MTIYVIWAFNANAWHINASQCRSMPRNANQRQAVTFHACGGSGPSSLNSMPSMEAPPPPRRDKSLAMPLPARECHVGTSRTKHREQTSRRNSSHGYRDRMYDIYDSVKKYVVKGVCCSQTVLIVVFLGIALLLSILALSGVFLILMGYFPVGKCV